MLHMLMPGTQQWVPIAINLTVHVIMCEYRIRHVSDPMTLDWHSLLVKTTTTMLLPVVPGFGYVNFPQSILSAIH